jgi:hypothetical protein
MTPARKPNPTPGAGARSAGTALCVSESAGRVEDRTSGFVADTSHTEKSNGNEEDTHSALDIALGPRVCPSRRTRCVVGSCTVIVTSFVRLC